MLCKDKKQVKFNLFFIQRNKNFVSCIYCNSSAGSSLYTSINTQKKLYVNSIRTSAEAGGWESVYLNLHG